MNTPARERWHLVNAELVRSYKRRHANKAYAENPEKFRRYNRAWRQRNLHRARQRDRRYRALYAEARREYQRKYLARRREYFRARNTESVRRLANWYVRQHLSRNTKVSPGAWPALLVETQRAKMKVKRLCRKLTTSRN